MKYASTALSVRRGEKLQSAVWSAHYHRGHLAPVVTRAVICILLLSSALFLQWLQLFNSSVCLRVRMITVMITLLITLTVQSQWRCLHVFLLICSLQLLARWHQIKSASPGISSLFLVGELAAVDKKESRKSSGSGRSGQLLWPICIMQLHLTLPLTRSHYCIKI